MSSAGQSSVVADKSYSEQAIERYLQHTELQQLTNITDDDFRATMASTILPKQLQNAIFVGHKATDLDSIASAIGASELYKGTPARASEVNSETAYALALWDLPQPLLYSELVEQPEHRDKMTCIVDHNQRVQTADGIRFDRLIGVIDHHAMQGGTVSTSTPIYVNIQPWGSACTIIAVQFFQSRTTMTKQTAGMLLSGILSDTLNLRSPTTTEYDCLAVSILSRYANVSDVNTLASGLFKAKSMELARCSAHQLVRGDMKTFVCNVKKPDIDSTSSSSFRPSLSLAFGVIETTDPTSLFPRLDELLYEMRALKAEEDKDLVFLAIVDIAKLSSYLILVSSREKELAHIVFPAGVVQPDTGLYYLDTKVSRKADFIPPIERLLAQTGWILPPLLPSESTLAATESFGQIELACTDDGCQTVRVPLSDSESDNEDNNTTMDSTTSTTTTTIETTSIPCSDMMSPSCHKNDCTKNKKQCLSSTPTLNTDDSTVQLPSPASASATMSDCPMTPARHAHHHHHHHGPSARALTRSLLSSYKPPGPHTPGPGEVEQVIAAVLSPLGQQPTPSSSSPSPSLTSTTSSTKRKLRIDEIPHVSSQQLATSFEESSIGPITRTDILSSLSNGIAHAQQQQHKQQQQHDNDNDDSDESSPMMSSSSSTTLPLLRQTSSAYKPSTLDDTTSHIDKLLHLVQSSSVLQNLNNVDLELPDDNEFLATLLQITHSNQHSIKFLLTALIHCVRNDNNTTTTNGGNTPHHSNNSIIATPSSSSSATAAISGLPTPSLLKKTQSISSSSSSSSSTTIDDKQDQQHISMTEQ